MVNLHMKNKRLKFVLIFLYIAVAVLFVLPSNFQAITPGNVTNVDTVFELKDTETSDNFFTVSVISYFRVTHFQKFLATLDKRIDLSKRTEYDESLSFSDTVKQGKISKESSINSSIIAAYEFSRKYQEEKRLTHIDPISIDYVYQGFITYYATNYLNIGDIIVKINNQSFSDYATQLEYLRSLIQTKDTILFTLDDGKMIEIKESTSFIFYPKYLIEKTIPQLEVQKALLASGGPSGGMIQTLSLVASLLKLNLQDLKIAGTGTIEMDANYTIGQIGGILQKTHTVIKNKMDYFIVPDYYRTSLDIEAIEMRKLSDKIKIIYVTNLEDAMERLVDIYEEHIL